MSRFVTFVGAAVALATACGGEVQSDGGNNHDEDPLCAQWCQLHVEGTAATACSSPLEPCLELCEKVDFPCGTEAIAQIECRMAAGAQYICEEFVMGGLSPGLHGGLEECTAERDALLDCECEHFCDCNEAGECIPGNNH